MQPDGENLWYFKLRLFALTNLYVRYNTLGFEDIKFRKLEFVAETLVKTQKSHYKKITIFQNTLILVSKDTSGAGE